MCLSAVTDTELFSNPLSAEESALFLVRACCGAAAVISSLEPLLQPRGPRVPAAAHVPSLLAGLPAAPSNPPLHRFPPLALEGPCFEGLFKKASASLVWVYQLEIEKDWFDGLSLRLEGCSVKFKSDVLYASKSV